MTTTPKLAILTIVTTLAYLGLAILGWGGFAAFFSHPARIALAVAVFVLSGAALFTARKSEPGRARGPRQPLGPRSLRVDRAAGRLSAGLHRPDGISGPSTGIPFAGSASCSSRRAGRCGSGRSSCSAVGSAGSSPSSRGTTLVTTGIYGVIRHPSYLGLLVNSLGWGLAFRSRVGVLLTALLSRHSSRA